MKELSFLLDLIVRGFDPAAYLDALNIADIDLIGLTHPSNWMSESEVEIFGGIEMIHQALGI